MRYNVSWKELGGQVVGVDAVDRWDAVVKASEVLGIKEGFSMSFLSQTASVKRPGNENLGRRKSLDGKEKASRVKEIRERARKELAEIVGGECSICGSYELLVNHHWEQDGRVYTKDICRTCNLRLSERKVLRLFKVFPPFEFQKVFIEAQLGLVDSIIKGEIGKDDGLDTLIRFKCKKLGLDPSKWLR